MHSLGSTRLYITLTYYSAFTVHGRDQNHLFPPINQQSLHQMGLPFLISDLNISHAIWSKLQGARHKLLAASCLMRHQCPPAMIRQVSYALPRNDRLISLLRPN